MKSSKSESWLAAWKQPIPWLALILLGITASSHPPRVWFWLSLLLILLLVGWLQALRGSDKRD